MAAPSTGLPCDVVAILAKHCWRCHGSPTNFFAPMPLVDLESFAGNGPITQSESILNLVDRRINGLDGASFMPPAGQMPEEDLSAMNDWLAAGAPAGPAEGCGTASMVGTWITPEPTVFATTIEAPVVGAAPLGLSQTLLTQIDETGSVTTRICTMDFEEEAMGIEFVSPVEEIQSPEPGQIPALEVPVGAPFPIDSFHIVGEQLTVNATVLNLNGLAIDLDNAVTLNGTVIAPDTVAGTTSFTMVGTVSLGGQELGAQNIPATGDPAPHASFVTVRVSSDPTLGCDEAAALLEEPADDADVGEETADAEVQP